MHATPSPDHVIDQINQQMMRSSAAVEQYSGPEYLLAHERAALDELAAEVRGQPILDLGVGGGRTVNALRALSEDYLGIDYSPEMVAACRARFPGVRFELADARDLVSVPDASIALAVFSCNGISMVGHADRIAILREVHRVLRPGGAFVFTTYNRDSPDATSGFEFPEFRPSANPARVLVRGYRWLRETAVRMRNRRRFVPHEVRTAEYAVINDRCHDFGVMLYYITLAEQRRQLEAAGFAPDAPAFEHTGRRITDGSRLDSMLLVARKPR